MTEDKRPSSTSESADEEPIEMKDSEAESSEETSEPEAEEIQADSAEPLSPEPEPEPEPEQPLPLAPPKPKGRWLAGFALLLAVAGVAGVGYLYYLLVYLQPMEQIRQESANRLGDYDQLHQSLSKQIREVEANTGQALAQAQQEQAERLASNEDAVLKSLNEALHAAPPSQREWKLAEAEYLLRIANHRVLMEQDSAGALTLLQAADQIMEELDDFSLHQVRARLADEIIALRQVPRDDLQGIYLRLEAIKSQLDNLPLPEPSYLQSAPVAEVEQSVWQTLYGELKKFIRIRSLDSEEAIRPLLAPEEVRYLELNLRLALEQVQLATLKRQQDVYEQGLLNVRHWLVEHTDAQDARTKALLESVDELLIVELARPLPEISGSLNELLTIRRSGS